MLKNSYDREEDIPENVRGAYIKDSSGKYVLDKLDDSHPKIVENKTLIEEKRGVETQLTAAKGQLTKLTNDKTVLESKVIPDGHVVVKAEELPILEAAKAVGLSKDELATMKTENDTLKREKSEQTQKETFTKAASALGFDPEKFSTLARTGNLDLVEAKETKDGKEVTAFYQKGEGDKKTPLKEFVEQSDTFKPFLSSLSLTPQQKSKTFVPQTKSDSQPTGNIFDAIRQETKVEQQAKAPATRGSLSDRFYRRSDTVAPGQPVPPAQE